MTCRSRGWLRIILSQSDQIDCFNLPEMAARLGIACLRSVMLRYYHTVPIRIPDLLLAVKLTANVSWLEPLRTAPAIVAPAIFLPLWTSMRLSFPS